MAFPLIAPKSQWVDSNGDPLVSGSLEFLDPADDSQKPSYPTYDDAEAQTNPNTNPIALDARGEAAVFLRDGEDYKVVLRDANNTVVWTVDDVVAPIATPSASIVTVTDTGGYYAADNVEAALQELGAATGAAIIGLADGAGNLSATDVEAAIAEMFTKFLQNPATLTDYSVESNSVSSSGGTLTLNLNDGNVFECTLTENITSIVIQNPGASGDLHEFLIKFTQNGTGGWSVAGWPSFEWNGGTPPVINTTATTGVGIVAGKTWNAGTTWYGDFGEDYS